MNILQVTNALCPLVAVQPLYMHPYAAAKTVASGIRVGVIARATADEAWRIALERFPEDRRGQLTHSIRGDAAEVTSCPFHEVNNVQLG